jgi:dihydroxyacetone kinase
MQRGARAAAEAAQAALVEGLGVRTVLVRAAEAWANRAGGASGALWRVALAEFAAQLDDEKSPTPEVLAAGITAATRSVQEVGKAAVGDKTMVDAMIPFTDTFNDAIRAGRTAAEAWSDASAKARAAAESTTGMMPRIGRARAHGDKSVGTPDPGAVSFGVVVSAVSQSLAQCSSR